MTEHTVLVVLAVLYWVAALGTIAQVGQPRKPVTQGTAVAGVCLAVLVTAFILMFP